MRNEVIPVYKRRGETPKQALDRFRDTYPEYTHETLSYAGRLDPLAEGVLIVLVGEACKEQGQYHDLPKTYRISIVYGVGTDTYDTLGRITHIDGKVPQIAKADIENVILGFIGSISQSYPPYSSKPVDGKPLFEWAREGRLHEVEIPTHTISIESISLLTHDDISSSQIVELALSDTEIVDGDFRQSDIADDWRRAEQTLPPSLPRVELFVECSSGTYMRQLAHDLGGVLNTHAITTRIVREQVGRYGINDTLK